jgi:hypothetical protein
MTGAKYGAKTSRKQEGRFQNWEAAFFRYVHPQGCN